jgi:hypothetical protein
MHFVIQVFSKLAQQPASLWVSIVALSLAVTSLVYSIRSTQFSRRLGAHEKKTDALQTLAEARFTVSQILLHLQLQRQATNIRSDGLSFLSDQIVRAEDLVKQLDGQFNALLSERGDALFIEDQRQSAKVSLASVKKIVDSLELVGQTITSAVGVPPNTGPQPDGTASSPEVLGSRA